jgi:hypothetical protein
LTSARIGEALDAPARRILRRRSEFRRRDFYARPRRAASLPLRERRAAVALAIRELQAPSLHRAEERHRLDGRLQKPRRDRLDERQLWQELGVSRTPIREALSVLEQEGFVRSVPRRGV